MVNNALKVGIRPSKQLSTFIVCTAIILAPLTLSGCNRHALAAVSGTVQGLAEVAVARDCVNEGGDPASCRAAASKESTRSRSSTTYIDTGSYRLMTQKRLGGGVTQCNYGVRSLTIDNYGTCPEYIK